MRIGFSVFCIGILIAISGAAKMAPNFGDWPDTTASFIFGICVAMLGLVLWKKQDKASNSSVKDSGEEDPITLLQSIVQTVRNIENQLPYLSLQTLAEKLESLMETEFQLMVENRNAILNRFGLKQGSMMLIHAANGERLLNRACSAAADGYVDESKENIPKARVALEEALQTGGMLS